MSAITDGLRSLINQIREKTGGISVSDRDRSVILLGGMVFLILILYIMFHFFSSGTDRLQKRVEAAEEELAKVNSLSAEYVVSKRKIEGITNSIKEEDGDLLPQVEKILVNGQVERGSFTINLRAPTTGDLYEEASVDVEINKIALDKVIDILYKFQTTASYLKLSKLRLQTRFDNPSLMDVSFRVSTFKFTQEL
ncbi:MAG TPA: hypothetical protein VLB01_03320 [Thermodesulfobacteriota bacterium]|nr:hypothetical protein [Thermodesulfobacteriota bacterium]